MEMQTGRIITFEVISQSLCRGKWWVRFGRNYVLAQGNYAFAYWNGIEGK